MLDECCQGEVVEVVDEVVIKVVATTVFASSTSIASTELALGCDVGHVFLCYGLDGPRSSVVANLRTVGIAVGGCVLFHSVVLHCDSVVVRGFPFGFTAAPQIFGVEFFCFLRPSKTVQKERFGSDTFWGPGFFGCSTQCKPYFCIVLRVRNSIRFGSSGFSVFFGAVVFVF